MDRRAEPRPAGRLRSPAWSGILHWLVRRLVPLGLRVRAREWWNARRRARGAPRMLWGYRCSSGAWRPRTRLSDTVFLYHPERIVIEDNVFVWHYTILDGTGGLHIGAGSQIGAWVGIFTHSSHVAIRLLGDRYQEVREDEKPAFGVSPVRIGRYVFVGAGAKLLPGITVGDGALIAAGSVVSRDVAAFAIVSGNPAEVVGDTRKLDAPHLGDPRLRAWYESWQGSASGEPWPAS